MSRIRTPPSLKWLIDKYARLLGELAKFDKTLLERITHAEHEVEKAERALVEARHRLAFEKSLETNVGLSLRSDLKATERMLSLHEIQINPELISQIRTQEADRTLPHGTITRSIYECLKCANGHPVTTTELTLFICLRYGIPQAGEEFDSLRYTVKSRAKNLCRLGRLERLHEAGGNLKGAWRLPNSSHPPLSTENRPRQLPLSM